MFLMGATQFPGSIWRIRLKQQKSPKMRDLNLVVMSVMVPSKES